MSEKRVIKRRSKRGTRKFEGKFTEENLRNTDYFCHYELAYDEDDLVRQDYNLMRVHHNDFISKVTVDDFWVRANLKESYEEENDKLTCNFSEEDIYIFNRKIKYMVNEIDNSETIPNKKVFKQSLILFGMRSCSFSYLDDEIMIVLREEMDEVREGVKAIIFDKGKKLSYLSRANKTILDYLNPEVPWNVFDKASLHVRTRSKDVFLVNEES